MNAMNEMPEDRSRKLRDAPELRESLRERLDRYLDLPLALASILLVLIAVVELGGEVEEPWRGWLAVLAGDSGDFSSSSLPSSSP